LIAAGSFGKGKVVWTGLDLAGHIGSYEDNPAEIKLFNNLIKYLLEGKSNQEVIASFSRTYPDKVEFIFSQDSAIKTAVYWKEAYHPDFKAKLIMNGRAKSIPVYKAGPGLTLFVLQDVTSGEKIVYEYKTPSVILFSKIMSLLVFLGVIVIIVKPDLMSRFIKNLKDKSSKLQLKKRIFTSSTDEDTNY
jgi:hypothetical protein